MENNNNKVELLCLMQMFGPFTESMATAGFWDIKANTHNTALRTLSLL